MVIDTRCRDRNRVRQRDGVPQSHSDPAPCTDVIQLAPGVASSGGAGDANPSISGGSGLENHYVIDGVNVSNAGYGAVGSYSSVFGSLGRLLRKDHSRHA